MKRQTLKFSTKLIYSGFLTILVLLLAGLPAVAQDMPTEPDQVMAPAPQQQGPSDPQELEAFLDGIFAAQMQAYNIPGATVAVVKDGELFFAKGYGYADLEKRTPVDPDKTLFRIGSVSKLLTWTAVMQLVEQGKLNLSEDVNTYLTDFKIPDTYPEPITLAHLMTHTAGFEERCIGNSARTAEDLEPLGELLATNMPARVRSPGELAAYSNYGAALAGYIVEEVSGMPFEEYIEKNISTPLEMHHSTFRVPLPLELAPDMAVGYTYENGVYRAEEFEYFKGIAPAGSMSATATDMAKFMIAHLQDGRYGDTRILNETTAKEMHRQHFTHDPRINGVCYGFYEQNLNNQRIIMHNGATIYFHSLLMLVPEQNVGLFVNYNSIGPIVPSPELQSAFLNRYYPVPDSPEPQPPSDFQQRAKQFTGSYKSTRSSYTTYEKVLSLTGGYPHVSATNDSLLVGGKQYVEVEDLFFHEVGGQQTLVFREDSQDRITHMFTGGPTVYIRLKWYETTMFHYTVLVFSLILFLSALVAWPIGALRNRLKGEKKAGLPGSRQARWVAWGMSALYVLFLAGLWVIVLSGGISTILYSVPPLLPYLLVLPLVGAVLTIAALGFTVMAWKNRYWGVAGRVHYTLVTVAALAFIWWLNYWNLLGFRF